MKRKGMTLEPTGKPDGQPDQRPEITLAKWSTRFWAWLVDFIIVTTAAEVLFAIAYAPLAFGQGMQDNPTLGAVRYAVQSLMFFGYWTYFESKMGQSIGKRLLKIKTTDLAGNIADVKSVAIQSFGKAFLLPIDVFFGWIFTNEKRQRLLSKASNTIVVKTAEPAESIRYRKE
jgi:uncharacterized RDD family membrane protein YckC